VKTPCSANLLARFFLQPFRIFAPNQTIFFLSSQLIKPIVHPLEIFFAAIRAHPYYLQSIGPCFLIALPTGRVSSYFLFYAIFFSPSPRSRICFPPPLALGLGRGTPIDNFSKLPGYRILEFPRDLQFGMLSLSLQLPARHRGLAPDIPSDLEAGYPPDRVAPIWLSIDD